LEQPNGPLPDLDVGWVQPDRAKSPAPGRFDVVEILPRSSSLIQSPNDIFDGCKALGRFVQCFPEGSLTVDDTWPERPYLMWSK
jgi:hypothetical protein